MQPQGYPPRTDDIMRVWRRYMAGEGLGRSDAAWMDPAVVASWERCRRRLDADRPVRPRIIGAEAFASVRRAGEELISNARPAMEDIFQFTEGSDTAILLTDGAACLLEVIGDRRATQTLADLQVKPGTYCAEGQLGTNAVSLALSEAMPVQVVGAEHFSRLFHAFSSTAAPIHDVNGRIIGVLALAGPLERATSHDLALVMSAARAITNLLHAELYVAEVNRSLSTVNTIVAAMTDGVIAWDQEGRLTHVNRVAARMLQLNATAAVGNPLSEVLRLPSALVDALTAGDELHDLETVLTTLDGTRAGCLLSLRLLREGNQEQPVGYLAILRPIAQVRRLVQQQVGAHASFTLDDLRSETTPMRRVLRQARIAARGTAPVLLRGEGGVGKNSLAHAIHNDGDRSSGPLIAVNCQALPHEIIVQELLGHEKDSEHAGRPSKFELADGGTLYLNQIESLSLEMQAALLHVIETGYVMRLNSTYPIPVDVRIIAATNADMEALVAERSFLEQLYYRFGVFTVTLPPLRERTADLPHMVNRFLARLTPGETSTHDIAPEAMDILLRYPWPGNIRELEQVLERSLHQSRSTTIGVTDLPEVVRKGRVLTAASPTPQPVLTAAEAEREAIIRAGWHCQGHVTAMARELGIGRTTLWRKMKLHKLTPEQFKPNIVSQ